MALLDRLYTDPEVTLSQVSVRALPDVAAMPALGQRSGELIRLPCLLPVTVGSAD